MDELIRTNVLDSEGNSQSCLLIEKSDNQNGGTLYTFRNENSGKDFTIAQHDHAWTHLNGDLPYEGCVQQLGDFLDRLEER